MSTNIINGHFKRYHVDGICPEGVEDTFTDESIAEFFGSIKNNSDNGSFDHIPDAGKKVSPKDNNNE